MGEIHWVALRTFLSDTDAVKRSEFIGRLGGSPAVEVLFVAERRDKLHRRP